MAPGAPFLSDSRFSSSGLAVRHFPPPRISRLSVLACRRAGLRRVHPGPLDAAAHDDHLLHCPHEELLVVAQHDGRVLGRGDQQERQLVLGRPGRRLLHQSAQQLATRLESERSLGEARGHVGSAYLGVLVFDAPAVGADAHGHVVHPEHVEGAAYQQRTIKGRGQGCDDAAHVDLPARNEVAHHDNGHLVVQVLSCVRDDHQRRARRRSRPARRARAAAVAEPIDADSSRAPALARLKARARAGNSRAFRRHAPRC
eukprot:scaffold4297_cov103-Isochrysis_galbana.AAC.1